MANDVYPPVSNPIGDTREYVFVTDISDEIYTGNHPIR